MEVSRARAAFAALPRFVAGKGMTGCSRRVSVNPAGDYAQVTEGPEAAARQVPASERRGAPAAARLPGEGGGSMHRSPARYRARQRGPPAHTFCDLTKRSLHDAHIRPHGRLARASRPRGDQRQRNVQLRKERERNRCTDALSARAGKFLVPDRSKRTGRAGELHERGHHRYHKQHHTAARRHLLHRMPAPNCQGGVLASARQPLGGRR